VPHASLTRGGPAHYISPPGRSCPVRIRGRVAEWLCRGLQILVRRFDSGPGLQFPHIHATEPPARPGQKRPPGRIRALGAFGFTVVGRRRHPAVVPVGLSTIRAVQRFRRPACRRKSCRQSNFRTPYSPVPWRRASEAHDPSCRDKQATPIAIRLTIKLSQCEQPELRPPFRHRPISRTDWIAILVSPALHTRFLAFSISAPRRLQQQA
jgi:hypothetical protein